MAARSDNEAMVIVVMGPAGAGKTTIGRALAEAIGCRFVEGDDYHSKENIDKLRRGMPLTDEDRAPWLEALHAVIARAIDRRMHLVVACSALKAQYRQMLAADLEPVRFVYLQTSADVLRQRLATREGHFVGPGLLASQLAALEEPADAITVDASQPPEALVAKIRAELAL